MAATPLERAARLLRHTRLSVKHQQRREMACVDSDNVTQQDSTMSTNDVSGNDMKYVEIDGIKNVFGTFDSGRLKLRRLQAGDYHKGFITCLGQLSKVGDITSEMFNGMCHYI
jgi:hypothetical protein